MPFVLDCSVSAAWCLPDETGPRAETLLRRLADDDALVPALWVVEMANILAVAERRERITHADGKRATELVLSLPIRVEPPRRDDMERLRTLAERYDLSAYDAAYLDLALREALELATLDETLQQAARECSVEVLTG